MTNQTIKLPQPGKRIGMVDGPGVFASDNAGTVLAQIDGRFGSHVLVIMDNTGKIEHCHGMNRPGERGIGWHYL